MPDIAPFIPALSIVDADVAAGAAIAYSKLALANSIATGDIANGAVTPAKRAGGLYLSSFQSHGTTGNKAITGVGFTPKAVIFFCTKNATETNVWWTMGYGMMVPGTQHAAFNSMRVDTIGSSSKDWSAAYCILLDAFDNTATYRAQYVSMDADGFTINVTNAQSAYRIGFLAIG